MPTPHHDNGLKEVTAVQSNPNDALFAQKLNVVGYEGSDLFLLPESVLKSITPSDIMIQVSLVEKLLQEVVASYPEGVYFLPFHSLKVGGYMSNGGHPNKAMHVEASEELYQAIKSIF